MKTETEAVIAPVIADAPAPVAEAVVPTPEAWQAYLDAVHDGAPAGKILPAALSALTLTDAQREELRDARRGNAQFAQANRKMLFRLVGRKCYTAGGVRIAKNANVSLRFVAADGKKKEALRAVTEFRAKLANA